MTFEQWWEEQDYEVQSSALGYSKKEIELRKLWALTGFEAGSIEGRKLREFLHSLGWSDERINEEIESY